MLLKQQEPAHMHKKLFTITIAESFVVQAPAALTTLTSLENFTEKVGKKLFCQKTGRNVTKLNSVITDARAEKARTFVTTKIFYLV
jgi:hypothetical protein